MISLETLTIHHQHHWIHIESYTPFVKNGAKTRNARRRRTLHGWQHGSRVIDRTRSLWHNRNDASASMATEACSCTWVVSSTAGLGVKNRNTVVLNNSCHESAGGQRTAASQAPDAPTDPLFPFARAVGYSYVFSAMKINYEMISTSFEKNQARVLGGHHTHRQRFEQETTAPERDVGTVSR